MKQQHPKILCYPAQRMKTPNWRIPSAQATIQTGMRWPIKKKMKTMQRFGHLVCLNLNS